MGILLSDGEVSVCIVELKKFHTNSEYFIKKKIKKNLFIFKKLTVYSI